MRLCNERCDGSETWRCAGREKFALCTAARAIIVLIFFVRVCVCFSDIGL